MFGVDSMEYIVIPDTAIWAVNRGKLENESSNIIYLDKNGRGHSIDFDVCGKLIPLSPIKWLKSNSFSRIAKSY